MRHVGGIPSLLAAAAIPFLIAACDATAVTTGRASTAIPVISAVPAPLPGSDITRSLRNDVVSGAAGCDSCSAQHRIGEAVIIFGSARVTRRASRSTEVTVQQESHFLNYLSGVSTFQICAGDRAALFFVLRASE